MKGVILNLLEEAVTAEHGEAAWPDLIDLAGVAGVYTSLGSYPDEEVIALVNAASTALQTPPAEILRWFGRRAIPLLANRYGVFFENHKSAHSFVLSVNEIIHPEVSKLYSGAGCPHFHFSDHDDGRLIIGYHSPRQMCHLLHGFVEGSAEYFGETVELEHLRCMQDGDPRCEVAVRWAA